MNVFVISRWLNARVGAHCKWACPLLLRCAWLLSLGFGFGFGLNPSLAQTGMPQTSRSAQSNAAGVTAGPGLAALLASAGPVFKTEQVRAELMLHAPQGVQVGQTFWLGLQIQHQPHWHTYWQNPGDSGLPTRLQWQLPAGLQAGDIVWPLPKKIPIGTLANYGYENQVLLAVPVTVR